MLRNTRRAANGMILFIFAAALALSSCMKQIPGAVKAANPILELEMDLFFMDLVAAQVKMNQLLLDRMPVSLEDDWPELLRHYSEGDVDGEKEKQAKKAYDECLEKALKYDFSFYRFYDLSVYLGALFRVGSFEDLMGAGAVALRGKFCFEASKILGRRYEHAKTALSSLPFGCICAYYSDKFQSLRPGARECAIPSRDAECSFFNRPTEEILHAQLFGGGISSWIDFKVPSSCFRVVVGEHLGGVRRGTEAGSFENVFYTLLPVNLRENLERVDEELFLTVSDLKTVEARLDEKGIQSGERAALNRQKQFLEKEKKNKEGVQERLYKQALKTVQVDRKKIAVAKKLLNIAEYIDDTFNEVNTAMIALTVKIVDDVILFGELGPGDIAQRIAFLTAHGIVKGVDLQKRFELLGKRAISLPVTWASAWGYAIAQKFKVSRYRDYLEALVKMEDKLKKGSKV
ncbi:MAG: hypothetical protein C4582_02775 [Desulfobacteraceae bacterium]|nr:MAG: hypothetical protein C4582_02775 [Desulfobacteraceae bacterium]